MVIIAPHTLRHFAERYPDAIAPMEHWIEVVSEADWSNVQDVRQTFNHADYVGNDRFVFNLRGNHYRIVAMIFFKVRTLFIRFVGTHQEYDKIEDITLI